MGPVGRYLAELACSLGLVRQGKEGSGSRVSFSGRFAGSGWQGGLQIRDIHPLVCVSPPGDSTSEGALILEGCLAGR